MYGRTMFLFIKMCVNSYISLERFVQLLRIIFVNGGLDSKLQYHGPCRNSKKKAKTSHPNRSGHIEGDIMHNHK
jgi:hypothetical protein